MKAMDAIVITGLGIEVPGIENLDALLTRLETPLAPGDFDPIAKLGRKGLRYKDQSTRLALCASSAALEHAGLPTVPTEQRDPLRFGVVVSSNLGNLDTVCKVVASIREGGVDATSPMDLPNASSNVIASSIAIWFGLKGPNLMLCNGATSGTDALYIAANLIRAGRADRVLVAGVEVSNPMVKQVMHSSLSDRLTSPEGLRLFQGAAALVLEAADVAAQRNAPVYAHLSGYGYAATDNLQASIRAATGGDEAAPDLWLTPYGAYARTSQAMAPIRQHWKEPATVVLDPGHALGETYGALGVLQSIIACLWLQAHGKQRALATSGAAWGDGSASLLLKAPAPRPAASEPAARRATPGQSPPSPRAIEQVLPETTLYAHEIRPAPTTGPVVAFVHGMEGRWDSWAGVWNHLHPQLHCFSLEMPWAVQRDYRWTLARQPHEYIKLGSELIPTHIDVLIAHSFGANAVLEYLSLSGVGSLKGLVLISPFYKAQFDLFDWDVLTYYVNRFQALLEEGVMVRQKAHQKGQRAYSPEVLAALGAKVRDRIGPYGWLQFFTLFSRTPDLHLANIRIPSLVLGGVHDFAAVPTDCAALAQRLPHARVVMLQDCGHFSMNEQPQTVALELNQFVASVLGLADREK